MSGPAILDLQTLIQAGIDPKTGLPTKAGIGDNKALKDNIRRMLRIVDEQDAVNRYVWYNLPANITSQELERMLYYRGQLCFFYEPSLDEFFFMPYALDGTIDFYGRFNRIHPIPMSNGTTDKGNKSQAEVLSKIKLEPVYGLWMEEITEDTLTKKCVLLHDYTKQLSQTIIPRVEINEAILNVMADCIPLMRTSLLASSGIKAIRVADADQQQNVATANRTLERAAMQGEPFVPIVGGIEFQELTDHATAKSEEYMLAMQSLDNFRLSAYGIDNGGLFEKKSHELQSEADINGGPVGLVMQDGLSIRQNFCDIVNSIFGIGIWCEPAENISGFDGDGDGVIYNNNHEGENSGIEGGMENDSEASIWYKVIQWSLG